MSGCTFVVPEVNTNLAPVLQQRYSSSSSHRRSGLLVGKLTIMEELELCLGDKNAKADLSWLTLYCQLTSGILVILAVIEQFVVRVMACLEPLQMACSSYPFHWHPTTQSFYMALINTWSIIVLVILFPALMSVTQRLIHRKRNATHWTVFNTGKLGAICTSTTMQILGEADVALTRSPR